MKCTYTRTSDVYQVVWFWRIVESYSEEMRARLLQFVTGSSRVPLQGFKALQVPYWCRSRIHNNPIRKYVDWLIDWFVWLKSSGSTVGAKLIPVWPVSHFRRKASFLRAYYCTFYCTELRLEKMICDLLDGPNSKHTPETLLLKHRKESPKLELNFASTFFALKI